jgi:hypothetical protein
MRHFFIAFSITTMLIGMVSAFHKIEQDALREGYYTSAPLFSYATENGALHVSVMGIGGTLYLSVPEDDNRFYNFLRKCQKEAENLYQSLVGIYGNYRQFIHWLIYSR